MVDRKKPMRILVADDNVAMRTLIATILGEAGIEAVTANDGGAAEEMLRRGRFDLALLDSRMPAPDGPDLMRLLPDLSGDGATMPVLGLVPVSDEAAETARCLAAGMAGVLVKPVRREQLLQAIDRLRGNPGDSEPPIDMPHLRRYTEGDAALERELMDLFIEGTAGYLAALAGATDDKAWSVAAHSLKGSARGIGATQVAALAEAAERLTDAAARARQLEDLREAICRVEVFIANRPPPRNT